MRILVTGVNGQVGFEIVRSLSIYGEILAPVRSELDLTRLEAVNDYLQATQPDVIVNAAAYTAVDKAETEQDLAFRINAELPAELAKYAQRNSAFLVHFSSDYVYPGSGDISWKETDEPAPLSTYGSSKLAGDEAIISSKANAVILRTSWVYSARGNNFMKTMLRLAKERKSLSVVADQVGAPTAARLLAQVATEFVAKRNEIESGVYHIAPKGETSWHGFANKIFELSRQLGEKLDIETVQAISTEEYPTPAKRPLNSRLNTNKIESELGIELPRWQSQLELTLKEYFGRFN
ncbi:dTDP-4-dehydrorhamnose reductase [Pseudidiomarina gelatinasegens]|uniref:dTDP-4-dehydrorhamnose reductase n=1 Tax=Pseudidiomarina gelatinasegens TaxID=2487740 RepID=A0A443Z7N8_9GAMM|nr:dTDP-4-dehydrorhamnose reductase [Pseudidiomarina gelatinasegens]RWU12944.1 dTDP-4-dehydrorhamnose reductase [Pseudidiomarina gelatinasegens]